MTGLWTLKVRPCLIAPSTLGLKCGTSTSLIEVIDGARSSDRAILLNVLLNEQQFLCPHLFHPPGEAANSESAVVECKALTVWYSMHTTMR